MFSEGMVKVCQRNGEVYVFMKRPRGCGCSEEGRVFWGMKGKYVSASKLSYAFSSLSSLQMLSFHSKNALFGAPNSNLNLEPFLPHLVRCFTKCFSFFLPKVVKFALCHFPCQLASSLPCKLHQSSTKGVWGPRGNPPTIKYQQIVKMTKIPLVS